jgi:hypothetical protein
VNVSLLHRRPPRPFAAPAPDPSACHCVVRHPATVEERVLVVDAWLLALWAGEGDRAGYLRTQLSTICPAVMSGPKCHCGCGNPPGQHNEMRAA